MDVGATIDSGRLLNLAEAGNAEKNDPYAGLPTSGMTKYQRDYLEGYVETYFALASSSSRN